MFAAKDLGRWGWPGEGIPAVEDAQAQEFGLSSDGQ